MKHPDQMTHEEWTTAILNVVSEIPEDWYFTSEEDGLQYLYPEYNDRSLVHLYAGLLRLGIEKGWVIRDPNS